MRSFEQYDQICKYFSEGKQKDNDTNYEAQKRLQAQDLSVGEHLTGKYTLWLTFRMIDENALHGTVMRIENTLEGVYLIMDTQLNIKDGAFRSIDY